MAPPPAPRSDPDAAALLTATLRLSRFDGAAVAALFAGGDPSARVHDLPAPLAAALRLFVIGETLPAADVERALGRDLLDAAATLGVVVLERDAVRPAVRIVPHDLLLLASDLPSKTPGAEHVAAAHAPSLTLARLTIRARADAALDLGTGNGVQALLLARHARHVVATDVNERALRFTELNAALNGVTNVETRTESFLDEPGGERFGIVTCNPPYVVSPDSTVLYRTAVQRGDTLTRAVVEQLPGRLADGGFATVLVSWVPGQDPGPLEWELREPCDMVVLELARERAADTAVAWNDPGDEEGLGRWTAFFRAEGIEEIAYGAVVLRRRDGDTWRSALPLPGGPVGAAGPQLERMFGGRDLVATPGWEARSLVWAPGVRVDGRRVALDGGLGLSATLDRPAADAPDAAEAGLRSELLQLGFLVPAD